MSDDKETDSVACADTRERAVAFLAKRDEINREDPHE
jgi:hypothetical protein